MRKGLQDEKLVCLELLKGDCSGTITHIFIVLTKSIL